jgi:hypothetical protein
MLSAAGAAAIGIGLLTLLGASGKRPSAVHDPKGYEEHVKAPQAGCLLIVVGVILLAIGTGSK